MILGFHSDNGSANIYAKVAKKMFEALCIEQGKSHLHDSYHSALAESKNASGVRKHLGYSPIPHKYGQPCVFSRRASVPG